MIKNKYSKKTLIILIIVTMLALVGFLLWSQNRSSNKQPTDNWQDGVNYRPPTDQEKAAGDDQKQDIVDEQDRQAQSNQQGSVAEKQTVSVAITDAGQYDGVVEVRSFVPSYSQDGTCTLSFTQGSRTFNRTTPGYKDVSSTVCPAVEVLVSEFPNSGEWQVVVSFESANAKGKSDPRTFSVEK
jgi:hypothetical protein